jgi:DNA-binding NarL/FixJ family response regulator
LFREEPIADAADKPILPTKNGTPIASGGKMIADWGLRIGFRRSRVHPIPNPPRFKSNSREIRNQEQPMVSQPSQSPSAAVLIVDDHPLVRKGFRQIIDEESDLAVCGEADSQSQAMNVFRRHHADLVMADLSLENGSGLELTRELLALDERVRVLICSMHEDDLYAERALRAGARGYINKHEPVDCILRAIRLVLEGRIYLSEPMTDRVLSHTVGNGGESPQSPIERLTDRELEVFEQIGHGVTTRQIAERLFLSPKTIETYRENIKTKLNLKNATELTRHAVKWVLENH